MPSLFPSIKARICLFVALRFFYYLLRPVIWGGGGGEEESAGRGKGGFTPTTLSQYINEISFHFKYTTDILTLLMTGVAGTCDSDPSS